MGDQNSKQQDHTRKEDTNMSDIRQSSGINLMNPEVHVRSGADFRNQTTLSNNDELIRTLLTENRIKEEKIEIERIRRETEERRRLAERDVNERLLRDKERQLKDQADILKKQNELLERQQKVAKELLEKNSSITMQRDNGEIQPESFSYNRFDDIERDLREKEQQIRNQSEIIKTQSAILENRTNLERKLLENLVHSELSSSARPFSHQNSSNKPYIPSAIPKNYDEKRNSEQNTKSTVNEYYKPKTSQDYKQRNFNERTERYRQQQDTQHNFNGPEQTNRQKDKQRNFEMRTGAFHQQNQQRNFDGRTETSRQQDKQSKFDGRFPQQDKQRNFEGRSETFQQQNNAYKPRNADQKRFNEDRRPIGHQGKWDSSNNRFGHRKFNENRTNFNNNSSNNINPDNPDNSIVKKEVFGVVPNSSTTIIQHHIYPPSQSVHPNFVYNNPPPLVPQNYNFPPPNFQPNNNNPLGHQPSDNPTGAQPSVTPKSKNKGPKVAPIEIKKESGDQKLKHLNNPSSLVGQQQQSVIPKSENQKKKAQKSSIDEVNVVADEEKLKDNLEDVNNDEGQEMSNPTKAAKKKSKKKKGTAERVIDSVVTDIGVDKNATTETLDLEDVNNDEGREMSNPTKAAKRKSKKKKGTVERGIDSVVTVIGVDQKVTTETLDLLKNLEKAAADKSNNLNNQNSKTKIKKQTLANKSANICEGIDLRSNSNSSGNAGRTNVLEQNGNKVKENDGLGEVKLDNSNNIGKKFMNKNLVIENANNSIDDKNINLEKLQNNNENKIFQKITNEIIAEKIEKTPDVDVENDVKLKKVNNFGGQSKN